MAPRPNDAYLRPEQWPWPEDTTKLQQVQRIAECYRGGWRATILGRLTDPTTALAEQDQKWHRHGHLWITGGSWSPDHLPNHDDWISATDAAHYVTQWFPCTVRDIYKWAQRGNIEQRAEQDGSVRYSWASIVRYGSTRRAG